MDENAFLNKAAAPSEAELAAALGPAKPIWDQLVHELAVSCGVDTQEWHCYSRKAGWSLRCKQRKRAIVYVIPCHGCLRVAFALGHKAVDAARQEGLPQSIVKIIDESRRYAEGAGVRLDVAGAADIAAVRTLALIKIRH